MASGFERYSHVVIIALAALLAGAIVALVVERRSDPGALEIDLAGLTPTPGGPIEVYVTGAVAKPGVYQLADGNRAVDALYAAGGPAPDANLEAINLAVRLHDEDRVLVPRQGQPLTSAVSAAVSSAAGAATTGVVNINTASAAELDALPGIGEVYSQRIVDSRTQHGPFATTDALLQRGVIPRATYEKIRDLITVGP